MDLESEWKGLLAHHDTQLRYSVTFLRLHRFRFLHQHDRREWEIMNLRTEWQSSTTTTLLMEGTPTSKVEGWLRKRGKYHHISSHW